MAKDRSNLKPESVTVRRQRMGEVDRKLPRSDDAKVHKAEGMVDNSSAVHHANAMDKVLGGSVGAARPLATGD